MFEQSKPTFGLVKLTPYHEVHIYTLGKIFVKDDIFGVRILKNPCTEMQRTFTLSQQQDGCKKIPRVRGRVEE
jgi:hypothetical protein